MLKKYYCMVVGEMKECIVFKMECKETKSWVKMIHPVLIQSLEDEFEIQEGCCLVTQAVSGFIFKNCDPRSSCHQEDRQNIV